MCPIFRLSILPIIPVELVVLLTCLLINPIHEVFCLPFLFRLLTLLPRSSLLLFQPVLLLSRLLQLPQFKRSLIRAKTTISLRQPFSESRREMVQLQREIRKMILLSP